MILLAVLGAIGILYVMIVQMSADALFTAQYYDKVVFKEKSYYISRSVYSEVVKLLTLDDTSYDSLDDQWAQELPPYHLKEENVYLSVRIEDLERYFNPNELITDNDEVENKHLGQFRRLLEVLELNPDLSNALLDWMDSDHERRLPGGTDGLDYTDIPVKGGALDSIEELKFIQGFNNQNLSPRVIHNRSLPGLREVLSIHTNGKINVNTARNEILLSLDEEMTRDLVSEIIRRREEKPFETMDDLLKLPGMNHDLLYRIKQLADVKSEHFKIVITVEDYDRQTADLTAVVKRSGQSVKLIYWHAD